MIIYLFILSDGIWNSSSCIENWYTLNMYWPVLYYNFIVYIDLSIIN